MLCAPQGEVINVRGDAAIMVNVKPNTWLTTEASGWLLADFDRIEGATVLGN